MAAHTDRAATHPAAALPLGTILRDPETGRLTIRFQVDDTTGRGMHAWYVPAPDPADARVLHHSEVHGWEPVELPPGVADVVRAVLERQAAELAEARASYWEVKETLESLKCERGADL
jgi:hypothetical protein